MEYICRNFQIYICCKKVEFDCLEYCRPFEECPDKLFDDITSNSTDTIGLNNGDTQSGTGTQALNVLSCRKGFKVVKGICKRIF